MLQESHCKYFFANVIVILKLPKSYKPITLFTIIAKVFERIVKIRTVTMLESMSYLIKGQYGFQESHSTILALGSLKYLINETLTELNYCSFISFDIVGAFDVMGWFIHHI